MNEGDIVLTAFTQVDGQVKNRPAVVLRALPPFGDLLLCGISTNVGQRVPDFDEVIAPADPDFTRSGLRTVSLIRLGFLSVVPLHKIIGSIGSVAPDRHQRLRQHLADHLLVP